MKFHSIPSALALSILAALIVATAVMRPHDDARASERAARCAGYERLTILLGNAQKAQNFSVRRCMDSLEARGGNI